jgi:hypothetical protein
VGMRIHQFAPKNRGSLDLNAFIREVFPNLPIVF